MKTKSIKTALLSATLLSGAAAAFAQAGGPFSLNGSVIASGGGTVTGGVYSVNGTIAQPLAGERMTNGVYSLTSGFWAAIQLVQTPGAPLLRITRTGATSAIISWPTPSDGWALQETTALASRPELIVWTDVILSPVVVVGSENTVTFAATTGLRYFRLRHP